MGRTNDDFLKANRLGFKKTNNQLKSWGLKFHKLLYQNQVLMFM